MGERYGEREKAASGVCVCVRWVVLVEVFTRGVHLVSRGISWLLLLSLGICSHGLKEQTAANSVVSGIPCQSSLEDKNRNKM